MRGDVEGFKNDHRQAWFPPFFLRSVPLYDSPQGCSQVMVWLLGDFRGYKRKINNLPLIFL